MIGDILVWLNVVSIWVLGKVVDICCSNVFGVGVVFYDNICNFKLCGCVCCLV